MVNKTLSIQILSFGLLLIGIPFFSFALSESKYITLTYTNEPLTSVFQQLSRYSGFVIVVDGPGKDSSVSGTIENLPLGEAVREILKRFNSTVVWDETNKAIVISLYSGSAHEETADSSNTIRPEPNQPSPGQDWFQQALEYSRHQDTPETDAAGRISGADKRFIQGTPTTP